MNIYAWGKRVGDAVKHREKIGNKVTSELMHLLGGALSAMKVGTLKALHSD